MVIRESTWELPPTAHCNLKKMLRFGTICAPSFTKMFSYELRLLSYFGSHFPSWKLILASCKNLYLQLKHASAVDLWSPEAGHNELNVVCPVGRDNVWTMVTGSISASAEFFMTDSRQPTLPTDIWPEIDVFTLIFMQTIKVSLMFRFLLTISSNLSFG